MNSPLRPSDMTLVTRAAEGMDRRRWSVAEIEAMVKAGIIEEDERFELIGGEIVPMSPKGILHETLKTYLNWFWMRRMPERLMMSQETTFRLSPDSFVEPDFVFYDRSPGLSALSPKTALLAVEVADSSLAYDRGRKARLYAEFGIPELWVIDAVKRETVVFSAPHSGAYANQRAAGKYEALAPSFAPELAVVLGELPES